MDKELVIENLNYVMEKRQHDRSYRALDRKWKTVLRYTPSAITALAFNSPGILVAFLYRRYTDKCRRQCNDNKVCYYKCYSKASNDVVKDINKQISKAKTITDDKKKKKVIKQLQNDHVYYSEKSKKFKEKLKKYITNNQGTKK